MSDTPFTERLFLESSSSQKGILFTAEPEQAKH